MQSEQTGIAKYYIAVLRLRPLSYPLGIHDRY